MESHKCIKDDTIADLMMFRGAAGSSLRSIEKEVSVIFKEIRALNQNIEHLTLSVNTIKTKAAVIGGIIAVVLTLAAKFL